MNRFLAWLFAALVAVAAVAGATSHTTAGPEEPSAATLPKTVWPLSIAADKRTLLDAKGAPTLLVGDSPWSIIVGIRKPDVIKYLDDRAARGVNVIIVNLIEHAFSPQSPPWKNAYGIAPFRDPNNFSTTVDAYFDHAEWLVNEARKRGIGVLLAPAYIGYGCGIEGWCAEMRQNGVARLEAYGRYVGKRFGKYKNVIWMHGGDHTPSDVDLRLVQAVRRGIEQTAGRARLDTYHWQPGSPPAADDRLTAMDLDTLYSYDFGSLGGFVLDARGRDKGTRPFFWIEGLYENEHSSRPRDWREQFYPTMLGGGAGFVFGNNPLWMFDTGWKQQLNGPGTKTLQIAAAFFRSIAWWRLTPEYGRALVSGLGDPGDEAYALAAANAKRTLALVYFTGQRTVTVDAGTMARSFRARWFNPSSGGYSAIKGSPFAAKGKVRLTPPDIRPDGSPDWLLVLDTAGG